MEVSNQTIRVALGALEYLGGIKLPIVTVALPIARLKIELVALLKPVEEIHQELIERYAERDEDGKIKKTEDGKGILLTNGAGFKEENDMLMNETVEVKSPKIHLPEMIASTCDKCHHNMDKPLEIEANIIALLMDFIEE